ncbi:MAG: M14 family metallopeptidase [bacterium]
MTEKLNFEEWVGLQQEPQEPSRRPHWSYREVWQRLATILGDHREVVGIRSYGASVRGEPLWRLKVSHPGALGPPVLVIANLHAMEHVGVVTAVRLVERAAQGLYGWKHRPLCVVPVANPDGFLAAEQALALGQRRFVRKNDHGVDLNRNFGVHWDQQYYLNRALKRFFAPGPAPLSEPEAAALDALAAREAPGFVASLHAFGEWIYTPWAGNRERPQDFNAMHAIAAAMADRQPGRRYRVLQLARRSRLFAACGAEIDHFYERHDAYSFLFEIGYGPRLREPSGWLHPYRWFSPRAARLEADVENVLPALDYLAVAER